MFGRGLMCHVCGNILIETDIVIDKCFGEINQVFRDGRSIWVEIFVWSIDSCAETMIEVLYVVEDDVKSELAIAENG